MKQGPDAIEFMPLASSCQEAKGTVKSAVKFRSVLGIFGAIFALVLGLGVGVAPAAVAADHSMKTSDPFPGGSMWFNTYGDVVTVCDRAKDGRYAVLYVYNTKPFSTERYKITAKGNGKCTTRKASMGSPFNLREGKTFGFVVCLNGETSPKGDFCKAATWKNST